MSTTLLIEKAFQTQGGQRILWWLSVIFILAMGLFVRLEVWFDWQAKPHRVFYQGEPVLMNLDGYYYLGLAQDLLEGNYSDLNKLRTVPDSPLRPTPPPLLSMLGAGISKIADVSLNWVAAFLPVVLGMTLILPVYLFGCSVGGRVMGLAAALVSVVSPSFVLRSGPGWFDTDCLLVPLVMASCYLFYRFSYIQSARRYLHLCGGFVVYWLMLWWWDQATYVSTVMILFLLLLSMFFYARSAVKTWYVPASIVLVVVSITIIWQGVDFPGEVMHQTKNIANYVTNHDAVNDFPGIKQSVAEQATWSYSQAVRQTGGHWLVLVAAVLGFALLIRDRFSASLFMLLPVGLVIAGYLFASRFLIFAAPVTGIGVGYVSVCLWRYGERRKGLKILAPIFLFLMVIPGYIASLNTFSFPSIHPVEISGMDKVSRVTPENAVIWTSWGHGYPMMYWGRRSTLADGGAHGSQRTVYEALPLTQSDPRLAANFMYFYSSRGKVGISKFFHAFNMNLQEGHQALWDILGGGSDHAASVLATLGTQLSSSEVDEWLRYFYPDIVSPLYLYIDLNIIRTAKWWYWYGSWNFAEQQGRHAYYNLFLDVVADDNFLTDVGGLKLDINNGTALVGNDLMQLNYYLNLETYESEGAKGYRPEAGIAAEYVPSRNMLVLGDTQVLNSVFNQLYLRRSPAKPYFELIDEKQPAYQLWLVVRDEYSGEATSPRLQ